MKNAIFILACSLLIHAHSFAQQAKLLSAGTLMLTSDTLYAIRELPGASRMRASSFTDTVRNAQLQRTGTTWRLRDSVRMMESQLALTFMHNGKLAASDAVAYDSMHLSVNVTYQKIGASATITERVPMRITHSEAAGVRTYARDSWFMPDVLWAKVEVDTFRSFPSAITAEQLKKNLCIFRAEILGDQYVVATPTLAPSMFRVSLSENGGFGLVWWNSVEWADSYDLEWTFVDNVGVATPDMRYSFKNNATRVTIQETQYEVPIVHGEGVIVFRVRANGRRRNGSPVSGRWTSEESGLISTRNSSRVVGNRIYIQPGFIHEAGRKNWQYIGAFAENGLRKDIVHYHDGALKNRQSVTQLSTDGKHLVVGEVFYDHHGRPVVQAMPVPFKPNLDAERLRPSATPGIPGLSANTPGLSDIRTSVSPSTRAAIRRRGRTDPFAGVGSVAGSPSSGSGSGSGTVLSLQPWVLSQLQANLGSPYAGLLPSVVGGPAVWNEINRYFEHRPALRYQPRFNVNQAGEAYSRRDFAPGSTSAGAFGTRSGAGNYYSPACPMGVPYRHLIPDSEGFPFTQTVYTPDLTGRVAKQSGVGPQFRIGSGHEVSSTFTTPTQQELDRLFGNDVGDARHYKKSIITDPNGQMVAQYSDPSGAVIATGALGSSPDNVEAVAHETLAQVADLVRENTRIEADGTRKVAARTVVITQDRSTLELDYSLTPALVNTPVCAGVTVCDHAVYDVRIQVFDQGGRRWFDHTRQVGTLDAVQNCTAGSRVGEDTTLNINRGTYTIEKTLVLNATNEMRYADAGVASARTCVEREVRAEIEPIPCAADGCVQCEYEARGTVFIRKAGNQPNCSRSCSFGAPNGIFNHLAYEALLRDVMPAGQYGELYYDLGGSEGRRLDVGRFPLSVFNTTGSRKLYRLMDRPAPMSELIGTYRRPIYPYRNADGSIAEVDVTENMRTPGFMIADSARLRDGRYYASPAHILDLEFLQAIWQEAWSESLVAYHPEYEFYIMQVATRTSLTRDTAMQNANYTTAVREGWLQAEGGPVTEATLRRDPFFASGGPGELFIGQMLDSLNVLRGSGGTVMHIHQTLRTAVHCNSPYIMGTPSRFTACVGVGASNDLIPEQQDQYWQGYRASYLAHKGDFMDRLRARAFPLTTRLNACMDSARIACPPCDIRDLQALFAHKMRRYQRDSCFMHGNMPAADLDGDGELTTDERRNLRDAEKWHKAFLAHFCGIDTLAFDWLTFFNGMLVTGNFLRTGVVIPSVPPLVVNADMIGRFPDRAISPNFRWNATTASTQVTIRITSPTGTEQARFTLRSARPVEWSKLRALSCLSCSNNNYTMQALFDTSVVLSLIDVNNLNLSGTCQTRLNPKQADAYFGKKPKHLCCTQFMPAPPPAPPCEDGQRMQERMNEDYEIAHRLELIRDSLIRNYRRQAMRAAEILTVSWSEPLYHFTLFYRDAAGNLIKTVPPKAVIPLASTTGVVAHRKRSGDAAWPAHNDGRADTLSTTFRYNGLDNKTYRNTPDGGITRYYFDEIGRTVASVNAEQQSRNALAYMLYDAQGRTVEAGVYNVAPASILNEAIPGSGIIPYSRISSAVSATPRNTSEVYKTVYDRDRGVSSAVMAKFAEGAQKRLRGRVARQEFYSRGDQTTYAHAAHLSYDIAGNVREFVQDFASLGTLVPGAGAHAIKHMRYRYDLLTGRVTESVYQPGQADQFYHWYQYDAEGRILAVQTAQYRFEATDIREREAKYNYYLHGPMARAEIGHDQIQGVDLAYTLRGQMKHINSIGSSIEADMGNDGRGLFATDAIAVSLQYFSGDYKPIGRTGLGSTSASLPFGTDGPAQYSGNVAAIITRNEGLDHGTDKTLATAYRYDQLGRLRASRTYRAGSVLSAPSANTTNGLLDAARDLSWTSLGTNWAMDLQYDKNGNISQLQRYGATGSLIDQMGYAYEAGTNKLISINDPTGQVVTTGVATDMPSDNVYTYDALGRLTQEHSGDTPADLIWSNTDKLLAYNKDGRQTNFTYDAFGRRALKQELGAGGKTTLAIRDLKGNVLSTYELSASTTRWKEVPIYAAAGRLAVWQPDTVLIASVRTATGAWRIGQWRGMKAYELTQHTGEVLATISDRKLPVRVGRDATWSSDYLMAQEYYPFGMPMPGRMRTGGKHYPFGYQGLERDDNLRGHGNSYTTEFRQYDPRVGRWLSLDPMMEKYAEISAYVAFANNPITITDPGGDDTEMNADQFMQAYSTHESAARAAGVSEANLAQETVTRMNRAYGHITIVIDESATTEAMSSIEDVIGVASSAVSRSTEAIEAYDFLNALSFRQSAQAAMSQETQSVLNRISEMGARMRSQTTARNTRRYVAQETARLRRRIARQSEAVERIIEASTHSRALRHLEMADRYLLIISVMADLVQEDWNGLAQTGVETGVDALVGMLATRYGLGVAGRIGTGALSEVAMNLIFPESVGDGVCTWVPNLSTIERTSENCRAFIETRAEMVRQIQAERDAESERLRLERMATPSRRLSMSGGF